jgi:hypothetical protein
MRFRADYLRRAPARLGDPVILGDKGIRRKRPGGARSDFVCRSASANQFASAVLQTKKPPFGGFCVEFLRGSERIRTAVEAFAELCLATRPQNLLYWVFFVWGRPGLRINQRAPVRKITFLPYFHFFG